MMRGRGFKVLRIVEILGQADLTKRPLHMASTPSVAISDLDTFHSPFFARPSLLSSFYQY